MARQKKPQDCEFFYNQKGHITKVLIPLDQLKLEFDSLTVESPILAVYDYIKEYNDKAS